MSIAISKDWFKDSLILYTDNTKIFFDDYKIVDNVFILILKGIEIAHISLDPNLQVYFKREFKEWKN